MWPRAQGSHVGFEDTAQFPGRLTFRRLPSPVGSTRLWVSGVGSRVEHRLSHGRVPCVGRLVSPAQWAGTAVPDVSPHSRHSFACP